MPTRDIKYSKHPHIKTLRFKNPQADIWHFCCSLYARSRPISLRYQFDLRRLLVAHFASLSCGSAAQLTIATLAQARAFSWASSFRISQPTRTTSQFVLETFCVWTGWRGRQVLVVLLSKPNWSFILNRRRVTNNMQIRSEIVSKFSNALLFLSNYYKGMLVANSNIA